MKFHDNLNLYFECVIMSLNPVCTFVNRHEKGNFKYCRNVAYEPKYIYTFSKGIAVTMPPMSAVSGRTKWLSQAQLFV